MINLTTPSVGVLVGFAYRASRRPDGGVTVSLIGRSSEIAKEIASIDTGVRVGQTGRDGYFVIECGDFRAALCPDRGGRATATMDIIRVRWLGPLRRAPAGGAFLKDFVLVVFGETATQSSILPPPTRYPPAAPPLSRAPRS